MDGYSYSVVEIGDQCWFAENLRTENYTNGDAIPTGLSGSDWSATQNGAVAVYGEGNTSCYDATSLFEVCDETVSLDLYGRMYNWHAVNDTRGLCPNGWHVPTDEEWTQLGNQVASISNQLDWHCPQSRIWLVERRQRHRRVWIFRTPCGRAQ